MSITNKLLRSRKVILDMLETRGYDVDKYRNYTVNEIDIMYRNTPSKAIEKVCPLDILTQNTSEINPHSVYLKYILNPKIRIQAILQAIKLIIPSIDLDEDIESSENPDMLKKNDVLILIISDKLSNTELLDNYLNGFYLKTGIFIQVFWINSLQITITEHEFVPQHRVLDSVEKQPLLEKFNIQNFSQLPIILQNEPVAKYYGMKKGDVCEITRPSETSGEYVVYRYCQ